MRNTIPTIMMMILMNFIYSQECYSNTDCQDGFACIPPAGDCDFATGPGECFYILDSGCTAEWDPVCGCDGATYSNGCNAILAGVGAAYGGECEQENTECYSSTDCQAGFACISYPGDCNFETYPGYCLELLDDCIETTGIGYCDCNGNDVEDISSLECLGGGVDYYGDCEPPCDDDICLNWYEDISITEEDAIYNSNFYGEIGWTYEISQDTIWIRQTVPQFEGEEIYELVLKDNGSNNLPEFIRFSVHIYWMMPYDEYSYELEMGKIEIQDWDFNELHTGKISNYSLDHTGVFYFWTEAEEDPQIGASCFTDAIELGYYNCYLQCYPILYLENGLGDGICDDFWGSAELFCPEFGYDCGDCNADWDGTDPLGFCGEDYDGPVWHIATDGSDETGDGSVDNPFATIQHGINTAVDGDTILVAPGTYFENINYLGKNISIIGEDNENTIIDGNQNGSVVTFENGEDSTAVLDGFTISNGFNYPEFYSNGNTNFKGGGIDIEQSNPILKNLIITNSIADSYEWESPNYGGGICIQNNCIVQINNVIVRGNSSYGTFSGGGGIGILESFVIIENSTIEYNTGGSYMGGGISSESNSNVSIINSIISNNHGNYGGGLSHFSTDMGTLYLSNVKLFSNSSQGRGGGMYIYGDNIQLNNVLLYNNISMSDNGEGGIYFIESTGILNHITVVNNSVNEMVGIRFNESTFIVNNSIIYDEFILNEESEIEIIFSNIQGGWDGEGNINTDPLFTDPENGDFTLQPNSPCIDAGDPNSPLDPDGTVADMGAFYYHQEETQITLEFNEINPVEIGSEDKFFTILLENEVDINAFQFNIQFPPNTIEIVDVIGSDLFNDAGINTQSVSFHEESPGEITIIWNGSELDVIPAENDGRLIKIIYNAPETSQIIDLYFSDVIFNDVSGNNINTDYSDETSIRFGEVEVELSVGEINYENNTAEIWINNTVGISEIGLNFSGIDLTWSGQGGLVEEYGWMISGVHEIYLFNFFGTIIPPSNEILYNIDLYNYAGGNICITHYHANDENGDPLIVGGLACNSVDSEVILTFDCPDEVVAGSEGNEMTIYIENSVEISGMQLEIGSSLPGFEISQVSNGNISNGFTTSLSNGWILSFSGAGLLMPTGYGSLYTVEFIAPENVDELIINFSDVEISNSNSQPIIIIDFSDECTIPVVEQTDVTLSFDCPESVEAWSEGNVLPIEVDALIDVMGFQFDIPFDSTLIEITDVTHGDLLTEMLSWGFSEDTLRILSFDFNSTPNILAGEGNLLNIHYNVLNDVDSEIQFGFDNVIMSNENGQEISNIDVTDRCTVPIEQPFTDQCVDLTGMPFPECALPIGFGIYGGQCTQMYCSPIDGNGNDWSPWIYETLEECEETCPQETVHFYIPNQFTYLGDSLNLEILMDNNAGSAGGIQMDYSYDEDLIDIYNILPGAQHPPDWTLSTTPNTILSFSFGGTYLMTGSNQQIFQMETATLNEGTSIICLDDILVSDPNGLPWPASAYCGILSVEELQLEYFTDVLNGQLDMVLSDIESNYGSWDWFDSADYRVPVQINEIRGVDIGDEIGLQDAAGSLEIGECPGTIGNVLVGAGVYTGGPMEITTYRSMNLCDNGAGDLVYPGWNLGNEIIVKIWDRSENIEYNATPSFIFGDGTWRTDSIVIDVLEALSVTGREDIPTQFKLHELYPNPFNPVTNIQFSIPEIADIEIAVYDIMGRKIETLYSGNKQIGHYNFAWETENLSAGIYFIHLKVNHSENPVQLIKKGILLK